MVFLSAHATNSRTARWVDLIENWAKRSPDFNIDLNIVELDVLRNPDYADWKKEIDKELPAIRQHHYDMIITLDNPALDLLIRRDNLLPPDVPVVFAGYEKNLDEILKIHPNTTGIRENPDVIANIELGLKLLPKTREIIILADASSDSQILLDETQKKIRVPDGVKVSVLSNQEKSIVDIFDVLRKKQEHSFLVFPPWREMAKNDYQTRNAMAQDLAKEIKMPFFISTDEVLYSGALGGYLVPIDDLAQMTTETASEILNGKSAAQTPVVMFQNQYRFNDPVLHEFGVSRKALPPGSSVVNAPQGIWQTHRSELLIGGILFLLAVGGVGGYAFTVRMTLRRARKLYSALPGRIGVINEREEILYMSTERELDGDLSKVKVLRDIPNIDYPKLSPAFREVFRTGQKITLDYEYMSVKRMMSVSPLSPDLFGQKALIWFSQDNSALQTARHQAEDYAAKLKKATRLWDILINSLPIHIFAKDADHDFRYIFSNRSRAEFFGIPIDELNGKNDFDLLSEENASRLRVSDEKNMADLETFETDSMEVRDAAGKIHIMNVVQIPFIDEDGSRILLGTAFDTSELVERRRQAEENAEWFKRTLQSIGDGVITTDANGNIVLINPVAERMIGVTQSEVIGRPHDEIFKIVGAYDDLPMQSPLLRTLRTGCIVELANHTDLLGRNGNCYHIADSAAPIFDNQHKIAGAILVFRDVTEEYENRDQLRDMLKMLEYSSELTKSAAFSLNLSTGQVQGSKKIGDLWPINDDGIVAPVHEWVYELDRPKVDDAVERLKTGKENDVVVDFRAVKDNLLHYYNVKMSVERSLTNSINLIGVIQDITDITVNMQEHAESVELWEMAISTLPIMFFVKDADNDFRYLMCNEAFAKFHDLTMDQVVGKNDAELLRVCPEAIKKDDQRVISAEGVHQFYYTVEDSHGFPHDLKNVKKSFLQASGKRIIVGASADITMQHNVIQNETAIKDALANVILEPTFDDAFLRLARSISGILNCDRVMLTKCNDAGLLRFYTEWHAPQLVDMDAALQDKHHKAWDAHIDLIKSGQLLKYSDFRASKINGKFQLSSVDYTVPKSLIVAPITIDKQLWGALFVSFSEVKRAFSESDESLMRSMADIIALAQIRDRQQQEIRRADREKQMILDHIHIPIWLHDSRGELVLANSEVLKVAGVTAEQLTTEMNREIFSSSYPPGSLRPVPKVLKTEKEVNLTMTFRGREYMVSAQPIFDQKQRIAYIVKSAIDITDLNQSIKSQKLVNFCMETFFAESDMKAAFMSVLKEVCNFLGAERSFVMRFDAAHNIASTVAEYHAEGCAEILSEVHDFHYSCAEPWYEAFVRNEFISWSNTHSDGAQEFFGGWYPIISKLPSLHVLGLYLDGKSWGTVSLSFSGADHKLSEREKGLLKTIAGILELFLEQMNAQGKILAALNQAQAADKAKSFFIASVSHEIRTPLNAVIGFAELLRDNALPQEERSEYLEGVIYSGNALLQLINDVLDLSKLEANQMQIVMEPADFADLCREIIQIFSFRAKESGVALKMQMHDLPQMQLDKLRIRQILFNLVGNAIKFTTHGSITLTAEFIADDPLTGTLKFSVIDTGIGIDPGDRQKLLEPFVQLSKMRGTNSGNNGTGLGLPICKRLVEKMDGALEIQSKPGAGSIFSVTLRHVRYDLAGKVGETVADALPEEEDTGTAGSLSQTILLVDDVMMNLKVMTAMFRKIGVSCIYCASSGEEALNIMKSHKIDLVLTDMWMPKMNGAKLAQAIHEMPEYSSLPVIAVTADIESKEHFETEQFSDVLFKPVTMKKCLDVLSKHYGVI
ncbi:MAG: ABC transporter substrate binding protein [Victivallaceae bacterium]|nr:ABC transporter substrate binding protein [Victivallaceae bacterium]